VGARQRAHIKNKTQKIANQTTVAMMKPTQMKPTNALTVARNSYRLAELIPLSFRALSARSIMSPGAPSATGTGYRGISLSSAEARAVARTLQTVLEIIAERIIAAAKLGERDSVRLRKAALPWLADE
jgi:hypothetical protein